MRAAQEDCACPSLGAYTHSNTPDSLTLDVKDENLTKLLNQWLEHHQSDNIYKPLHLILNQHSSSTLTKEGGASIEEK